MFVGAALASSRPAHSIHGSLTGFRKATTAPAGFVPAVPLRYDQGEIAAYQPPFTPFFLKSTSQFCVVLTTRCKRKMWSVKA